MSGVLEEELRSTLREIVRVAPDVDELSQATRELAGQALDALTPHVYGSVADELLDATRAAMVGRR